MKNKVSNEIRRLIIDKEKYFNAFRITSVNYWKYHKKYISIPEEQRKFVLMKIEDQ